jgi:hypothetical protein
MNGRPFLARTPGAATLSASAPHRDRKKVLISQWESERIEDLKTAVPKFDRVVAEDSLEQVCEVDAVFGFIDAAHLRSGKNLRWLQQGSAVVQGVVDTGALVAAMDQGQVVAAGPTRPGARLHLPHRTHHRQEGSQGDPFRSLQALLDPPR